ncbi:MAG: hypothetical protein N2170_06825 [Bacteroidia bacterium]|nr:hypothetical protein [Bacteroidia bacterium]
METFIAELNGLQYLSVALLSGVKFMVGVAMSLALGLNFWEQFLSTTIGGIAGVSFFTYLGDTLRSWIARKRNRPLSPLPSAKWSRLWEKYGLWGVALLTPPILSPPIGTAIALAFGTPRPLLLWRMSIAMVLWGLFFAGAWQSLHALWNASF